MGYLGTYRYTGYSVNGVDVFIWILLTVGTMGFPIVVFTICCLKKRCKEQRREHELLYAEPVKVSKKGVFGPFAGSQDNIEKKQPSKKQMPEIIISPNNFNSPDTDKNGHVRFKDDASKTGLPSLNMSNNFDYRRTLDSENYTNIKDINTADLRSLKDAVPIFNKSGRRNKPEPVLPGNLPQLNFNSNRYAPNPILDNNNDEIIYSSDDNSPRDNNVYSITNSYAQPGVQAELSMPAQLPPNDIQNIKSLENIYSQVISSSNRNSGSNQQRAVSQQEPTFSNYIGQNQQFYDTDQPLYMNTTYMPSLSVEQLNNGQLPEPRTSSKNFNNWDDSSV